MKSELDPIIQGLENQKDRSSNEVKLDYTTGFLHQLHIVCWRAVLSLIRNPMATFLNVFFAIIPCILGLLTGTIYVDIDSSYKNGIQNRY